MTITRSTCALLALLFLAGCNTPGSRIKKNQALFDSFPPEAQAAIKEGRVDIGFTRPMVDIAMGKPDRIYTRRTATGTVDVLAYSSFETQRDRQHVQADVRVRDSNGSYRTVRDWFWVDVESRREYDRLRIEMTSDVVTAIEESNRRP